MREAPLGVACNEPPLVCEGAPVGLTGASLGLGRGSPWPFGLTEVHLDLIVDWDRGPLGPDRGPPPLTLTPPPYI